MKRTQAELRVEWKRKRKAWLATRGKPKKQKKLLDLLNEIAEKELEQ